GQRLDFDAPVTEIFPVDLGLAMPAHTPGHRELRANGRRLSWTVHLWVSHIKQAWPLVRHARPGRSLRYAAGVQAEKDSPHPQVLSAFGLTNLNDPLNRSFWKSS